MFNIDKNLFKEIEFYCQLNNITDIDQFCNDLLLNSFTIKKYGTTPEISTIKLNNIESIEITHSAPIIIESIIPINDEHKKQIKEIKSEKDDYKIYDDFD